MARNSPNGKQTLVDVIEVVTASAELGTTDRRDMLSALNCLCTFARTRPEAVPLDVRAIDSLFKAISPAAVGRSKRTIRNVRSGVFRAIAMSKLVPVWRNQKTTWTDDWKCLHEALQTGGRPSHQYFLLRGLATWCSREGLAPRAVDDAALTRFAAEMETTAAKHRNGLTRDIARKWNEISAKRPDLALPPLTIPAAVRRNRRLHLNKLPDSFRPSLDGYAAYLRCDDPLADGARSRPLRPSSVTAEVQAFLTLANSALANGVDPRRLQTPDDLLDVEVAKAAFRFLLARSEGRTTGGVERIRKALLAYGRHRLADDPGRLLALKDVLRKIRPLRPGMTDKNAIFLRETTSDDVRARLLAVPDRLFHRGMKRLAAQPVRALADIQTAIAVEVLLLHALRRKNLGTLAWSRHIVWPQGDASPSQIFLPGEEMKNGEPMTRAIGKELARMLVAYSNRVLPATVTGSPDALFCRADGEPLSTDALVRRICRAVGDLAGVRMTPHQFRHFSATMILDARPEAYELARDHLGHSTSTVTARYYAGLRPLQASRVYGDIIDRARTAVPRGGRNPNGTGRRTSPPRPPKSR